MPVVTEKFPAIVTSNTDPLLRGRIKVACIGLLGDEESEYPEWVELALDWGWFYVPDVGEQIEVEVVAASDLDEVAGQEFLTGADIRWRGKRFYSPDPDAPAEPTPINKDFTSKNYGKRRGFATPAGHVLYFDDTPGDEKVQLSWKQGETYQFLAFDEKGSTIISNKKGSLVFLDAESGAVVVIDEHGNSYSSDAVGIKLIDKFSNIIEMKNNVVQIISQDAVVVTGKSLNVKTGSVDLISGADNKLVRGDDLKTYSDGHGHSSGMGPTGVPIVPMPVTVLSANGKVK